MHTLESINVISALELNGTASALLDTPQAAYARHLYAYKFMRRCPEAEVQRGLCFSVPVSRLPLDMPVLFTERSFGVDPELVVPGRVIHFAAEVPTTARQP